MTDFIFEKSIGFDGKTKAVKSRKSLDHIRPTFGFPWYLIHRVDLHNELKRLAFYEDGLGPPAALKTGHRVMAVVSCLSLSCLQASITDPHH